MTVSARADQHAQYGALLMRVTRVMRVMRCHVDREELLFQVSAMRHHSLSARFGRASSLLESRMLRIGQQSLVLPAIIDA